MLARRTLDESLVSSARSQEVTASSPAKAHFEGTTKDNSQKVLECVGNMFYFGRGLDYALTAGVAKGQ